MPQVLQSISTLSNVLMATVQLNLNFLSPEISGAVTLSNPTKNSVTIACQHSVDVKLQEEVEFQFITETAKKREKVHLSPEPQGHTPPPLSKFAVIGAAKTQLVHVVSNYGVCDADLPMICTKEAIGEEAEEK